MVSSLSAQTLAHLQNLCALLAQKKPELQSRISKAYDLLLSGGVVPCPVTPGNVWVRGRKGKKYEVSANACPCKDTEKRPGVACKHRISRRLYWTAMREEAIQEAARIAKEEPSERFTAESYVNSGAQLQGVLTNEARVNLSDVVLYRSVHKIWLGMIQRCNDMSNKNYGGRGVRVCDEWRASFPAFMSYIGPRPGPEYSIDRISVDGHYEPGNVRWATPSEQARNKRPRKLSIKKDQDKLEKRCRVAHDKNASIASKIPLAKVVSIYNKRGNR